MIDDDTISDLATSPQRTRTDEGTVEERPIKEVIEADRYLLTKEAQSGGPPYGMRVARTKPPGTV